MTKSKKALNAYAKISYAKDRFGRDAGFIANVLLNCNNASKRIPNLLSYLEAGHEFSCLSFRMPYEGFFVDGYATRLEFLDAANNDPKNFRLGAN